MPAGLDAASSWNCRVHAALISGRRWRLALQNYRANAGTAMLRVHIR